MYFFWISASIAEAAAVIPTTFINGPANLLNKDPKNPPDWIILVIWALESFISIYVLLLRAFLSFVFCLIVNNNSCGKLFSWNIPVLILKVVPVLFFTAFVCTFDNKNNNNKNNNNENENDKWEWQMRMTNENENNWSSIFNLCQLYIYYNTFVVPSENFSIVSFDCSRM